MHAHFLDPYRPRISPIHALDPRIKFVLAVACILTAALMPLGAWAAYLLLFAVVLSVIILSELGVRYVLGRSALAFPFVLAALPLVLTAGPPLLAELPLGPWTLQVSQDGVVRFASIAVKSWISVQAAIVLSASTSFPDLLVAMRAVRVPRLLVAIFGLMWRYLFVLADEVLRLIRARAARSGESGEPGRRVGGSLAWRARVTGGMAGNLFLRALERGDRIYLAMAARGYDGEVRHFPLPPLAGRHWFTLAGGMALLAVLLVVSLLNG
ncbi:MAG: cobalt ECF transporter T component CbiQ [Chloroflexi bacterium]|nr:cobalt ECF transporter T component CbiQ [Chloroflexota bacterium]